jgi:hypothetical protein
VAEVGGVGILLREGPIEETRWRAAGVFDGEWPASMGSGRCRRPRRPEEKKTRRQKPETQGVPSGSNPPQPYLTRRVSGGSVGLSPSNTGPPNGLVRIWGGFTLNQANSRQTQLKHGCRTRPKRVRWCTPTRKQTVASGPQAQA